ncbi:30S ribosomal protein S17 [Candidatus Woesearchaeota archaeon]|nr:30S ribosomal protein S17 [Candidatus Woesearchaeota archaeon]
MTECNDKNCPKHHGLKTRGRTFTGTVIASRMQRTATIEWPRTRYITKFERYGPARTRIKAHNPACLNAKNGDVVEIAECRPLSKTKKFTITQVIGRNVPYLAREELLQQAKQAPKEGADEGS